MNEQTVFIEKIKFHKKEENIFRRNISTKIAKVENKNKRKFPEMYHDEFYNYVDYK